MAKLKKNTAGSLKIGYASDLAEKFGLPDFEHLEERNADNIYEAGEAAYERAKNRGEPEDDAEETRSDAEHEAQSELFNQWKSAVESALTGTLDELRLNLEEKNGVYYVSPQVLWLDTVDKIVEVINGVGMFEFASVAEFLRSGPYTSRQAVEKHFVYAAKMFSKVYGRYSIEQKYRDNFR